MKKTHPEPYSQMEFSCKDQTLNRYQVDQTMKDFNFENSWLNPDDPFSTADEYFKQISYTIGLEGLYTILKTCYYNNEMKYCPILLEIGDGSIRSLYKNRKYLLQVWNQLDNNNINIWTVTYKYLLYTLEAGEEDTLNINDLEKGTFVKVKNFSQNFQGNILLPLQHQIVKYISYNNEILYLASDYEVRVISFPTELLSMGEVDVFHQGLKVRQYKCTQKIHGLILDMYCIYEKYQLIVIETKDSQLDFTKLIVQNINDDANHECKWVQSRHISASNEEYDDPIVRTSFVFSNGFNYSVALRKSGGFDLYQDLSWKEAVNDMNIIDINMSINAFYFKAYDGTIHSFSHKNKNNISFQQSEKVKPDTLDFNKIHIHKVLNIVRLFAGFQLVFTDHSQTLLLVAHGRMLSIYDIKTQVWQNHIEFEDDILCLFRHNLAKNELRESLLLRNGSIFIDILAADEYLQKRDTVKGKIIRTAEDVENQNTFYIVHSEKEILKLSMIFRGKLTECKMKSLGFSNFQENLNVVFFQYRGADSYLIIQNGIGLKFFKQSGDDATLEVVYEFEFQQISGLLHCGAFYDIGKGIFVFDQKNMYTIIIEDDDYKCITYNNVYCKGIQNYTQNFNYAICQETADSICPGLRLFDMESIITNNEIFITSLKSVDIGVLQCFDYSSYLDRITFLESLTQIVICPSLHWNMIKFMGISPITDYICYDVIDNYYVALKKTGELQSWHLLTGKFAYEIKINNIDLSQYELMNKYIKGPVLLRSKQTIADQKDEDYFFSWELITDMQGQIPFVKSVKYQYKQFIQIEITSARSVSILLDFILPSYSKEWIFINRKRDRMLNVLSNYRTYFSKAIKLSPGSNKVKWQLIRCLDDYPIELEYDTFRLEYFSPCLKRYLKLDKRTHEFIVKDTYTQNELFRIPKDLLTVSENDAYPHQAINRIQWITKDTMLIVNKEGMEKIINLDKGFKEISYNFRPLFNQVSGEEWKKYYYYRQREDLHQRNTSIRLQRFYQDFKTNYYLHSNTQISESVDLLFRVDPIKFSFVESTFSFAHWSIIEQLLNGTLSIENVEFTVLQSLVYAILPGANTVFHCLTQRKQTLIKILELCHPENTVKLHIPFLQNFKGETMISLCLKNQDFKSVDTILLYLSLYPIGHHSRALKEQIPTFIELQLPSFLNVYLDSRFQQTEQIAKITKGAVKQNTDTVFVCDLWFKKEDLFDKMFDRNKKVQTPIKLEFLDLPDLYHYLDPIFSDFFLKLAETDNFDYFASRAIQKLIEFNYSIVQNYITYAIVFPFTTFHFTFVFYQNLVYEHRTQSDELILANKILGYILLVFAAYFTVIESIQFTKQGIRYIKSIYNYVDAIAILGVGTTQILQIFEQYGYDVNSTVFRVVLVITTFFMWVKFLYLLRIFKKTGYLVRMIIEVISDMGIFLLILLITVLAFGDSFLKISLANESEDQQFVPNFFIAALYAYRMLLGDFDTTEFGEEVVPLVWILFLLCTIFDMIVMLNLLIAIISDTYSRMSANSDQAAYQEMATLIGENSYIIPIVIKKSYAQRNKFLVCLTELDKVDKEQQVDPLQAKIHSLQKQISDFIQNEEMRYQKEKEEEEQEEQLTSKALLKNQQLAVINEETRSVKSGSSVGKNFNKKKIKQIVSRIHLHPLEKMTLKEVRKNGKYKTGFGCNGRHFIQCQSGSTNKAEYRSFDDEELYHCDICLFDYCTKCFEFYKNAHHHVLKKITYADIKEEYKNGWLCDSVDLFRGCPNQNNRQIFSNENTTLYHDEQCYFDLCEVCAEIYRADEE